MSEGLKVILFLAHFLNFLAYLPFTRLMFRHVGVSGVSLLKSVHHAGLKTLSGYSIMNGKSESEDASCPARRPQRPCSDSRWVFRTRHGCDTRVGVFLVRRAQSEMWCQTLLFSTGATAWKSCSKKNKQKEKVKIKMSKTSWWWLQSSFFMTTASFIYFFNQFILVQFLPVQMLLVFMLWSYSEDIFWYCWNWKSALYVL